LIIVSTASKKRGLGNRSFGRWKIIVTLGVLCAAALHMPGLPRPLIDPALSNVLTADYVGATAGENLSTTPGGKPAELFGLDTEPVFGGALPEKWRRVEARITRDREAIAQCRVSHSCSAPAQKLIDLSLEGAGRSSRARVGLINRAVDLAIRPVSDEKQWGVPDRWSDPFETLISERGDCEDYAILKYTALLEAGFPKEALKIVVWKNRWPEEDHAVLAVRVDNQWLILDNLTLALVRDTDVRRVIPEFVLDGQGVRRLISNSWLRKLSS
jgi:predicted transglutaminase-like cysteine proteinase